MYIAIYGTPNAWLNNFKIILERHGHRVNILNVIIDNEDYDLLLVMQDVFDKKSMFEVNLLNLVRHRINALIINNIYTVHQTNNIDLYDVLFTKNKICPKLAETEINSETCKYIIDNMQRL
jgi:hypothetical protein